MLADANEREMEAERLMSNLLQIEKNISSVIDKECNRVITQKLAKYESVTKTFSKFFNHEDIINSIQ